MPLPDTFAAAVHIHLFETAPRAGTRVARDRQTFCTRLRVGISLARDDGPDALAGIVVPKDRRPGCAIVLHPPGAWRGLIYATRGETVPLAGVVARFLLEPPAGVPVLADGVTVWYTAAARRECSNNDMDRNGTLLAADLTVAPRTGDLLDDPAFWSLVRAVRANPTCLTTAGALADFVQERGFERLAETLREERVAAFRILPSAAACPSRFVTRRVAAATRT